MKKKKKQVVKDLGLIARLNYLEENPHGYKSVKKIHKSKKKYNRKIEKDSRDNSTVLFF